MLPYGAHDAVAVLATAGTRSDGPSYDREATAAITLGDFVVSSTAALRISASSGITLDDAEVESEAYLALVGQADLALEGIGLDFVGALAIKGALGIVLDDFEASSEADIETEYMVAGSYVGSPLLGIRDDKPPILLRLAGFDFELEDGELV